MIRRQKRVNRQEPTTMKTYLPLGLALLVLSLAVSCTKKADPDLLAKVGTNEIRTAQFLERLAQRGGGKAAVVDKQALLEELVEREVLYYKALQAGVERDPEVRRSYRNLVIGTFRDRQLKPLLEKATVSTEEIRAYYKTNQAVYTKPTRVRLALLYRKATPQMSPEELTSLRGKLDQARQQALEEAKAGGRGLGFGALAIDNSEDQASRYRGGDIGWIVAGRGHARWSQPVLNAGFALTKVGEISDIVTDTNGLYVVKLMGREETSLVPLEQVQPSIRQRLLAERRAQIEREFLAQLRTSVPVEIHPDRLEKVPVPERGGGQETPPSFP